MTSYLRGTRWVLAVRASLAGFLLVAACDGDRSDLDGLEGRWRVTRSVRADSAIKVPTGAFLLKSKFSGLLEIVFDDDLKNTKPTIDSVLAYHRIISDPAESIVEFDGAGHLRDPSGALGGDGLYLVLPDSIRVTTREGTRTFDLDTSRTPRPVKGVPDELRLGWRDPDDRIRIVGFRELKRCDALRTLLRRCRT